jgi:hypothetical protein
MPKKKQAAKDIELQDILDWADGVRAAYGTEHASKISEHEARVANAILRTPKPCKRHKWVSDHKGEYCEHDGCNARREYHPGMQVPS